MEEIVHYAAMTPAVFRRRLADAPIAYLPLGTLEWHGEHLPLGSDGLQAQGFFERLAHRVGGIVLPMLFLAPDMRFHIGGKDYYGMDYFGFPGDEARQLDGSAYWVPDDFFAELLGHCLAQLRRAGFRVVVAHGHAPSVQCVYANREDWEARYALSIFSCWREDESDGLGIQTDHAGENESSLMMAMYPHWVHMECLDPNPDVLPVAIDGGDPRTGASAERGNQAITINLERMEKLLRTALASF